MHAQFLQGMMGEVVAMKEKGNFVYNDLLHSCLHHYRRLIVKPRGHKLCGQIDICIEIQ